MNFDENTLIKLAEDISSSEEIKLSDIPCIDLYMDQITTFFDEKLKNLKRDGTDKILTKTMINNYTKAKILMPAKSKKYNKEQIILLVLIYNLKQILSINDIDTLFQPMLKTLNTNNTLAGSLDNLYSNFLEIKQFELDNFTSDFKRKLDFIRKDNSSLSPEEDETNRLILTVLTLINSAYLQKRMAEKILDTYFKIDETTNSNKNKQKEE